MALALLLLGNAPLGAQEREAPAVSEYQAVAAIDVLVELAREKRPDETVEPPADLGAGDFTVTWDGSSVPVLALAGAEPAGEEPWQVVVYFDRVLASRHAVRWAAAMIAERADELTRLGDVELVVADPEPRRLLAPTRDPELIDTTLGGLFLEPEADNALVGLRESVIEGSEDGPQEKAAPLDGAAGVAREVELLRRRMDALLGWAVDPPLQGPRKLLFWVSDGFDLRPADFYAETGEGTGAAEAIDLTPEVDALGRTLAAYGWILAPVTPPHPDRGVKLYGVGVSPGVPPLFVIVRMTAMERWLDGKRRPKRAAALAELGDALRGQGRLEDAGDAYRKAVFHYDDRPKSALQEAAILAAWGEVLRRQGRIREGRETQRRAVAFDPSLAERFPFTAARLLAPLEPLAKLAGPTAGRTIAVEADLDALLTSAARRLRLTYQVAGPPDGELHEVRVESPREQWLVRTPSVGRLGTPPAVAELRLRRLLAGDLDSGDLPVTAELEGRRLRIRVRGQVPVPGAGPRFRISWASASPSGELAVGHQPWQPSDPKSGALTTEIRVRPDAGHELLALVVEDLDTTTWGGAVLELP